MGRNSPPLLLPLLLYSNTFISASDSGFDSKFKFSLNFDFNVSRRHEVVFVTRSEQPRYIL